MCGAGASLPAPAMGVILENTGDCSSGYLETPSPSSPALSIVTSAGSTATTQASLPERGAEAAIRKMAEMINARAEALAKSPLEGDKPQACWKRRAGHSWLRRTVLATGAKLHGVAELHRIADALEARGVVNREALRELRDEEGLVPGQLRAALREVAHGKPGWADSLRDYEPKHPAKTSKAGAPLKDAEPWRDNTQSPARTASKDRAVTCSGPRAGSRRVGTADAALVNTGCRTCGARSSPQRKVSRLAASPSPTPCPVSASRKASNAHGQQLPSGPASGQRGARPRSPGRLPQKSPEEKASLLQEFLAEWTSYGMQTLVEK